MSAGLDLFPTVSPDGTAVAYASDRSGRFEIVVKALAPGGGERAVTTDGQQNVQPAWSPDGRYLAYHSRVRGGIWLVPALGGVPRQLLVSGSAPAWSPDGEWVAYQTSAVTDLGPGAGSSLPPSTLGLVRVATGERRALTRRGRPEGGHGMAAWWPDGSRVVFIRGGAFAQDVWTVPADGGAPVQLAECRSACLDPFFGPDDALYLSDGRQPRLWRLVVDQARGVARGQMTAVNLPVGGNVRRVSVSANRRIAAFAVVQIRSNLASVAVGLDGAAAGDAVRLTNDTSRRNTNPAYSPDGRRVAYTVGRAGIAPDIWTIGADGSNPVQMTLDGGSEGGPQWSPDGRFIAAAVMRDGVWNVASIDTVTGRERLLTGHTTPRVYVRYPDWARTGSRIVFEEAEVTGNIWVRRLGEPAGSLAGIW